VVEAIVTGLDARLVVRRGEAFRIDVSLRIDGGTTLALMGPNGAGKSTAVMALAGVEPLVDGHVVLDGVDLERPNAGVFVPPEARRIGIVFQDGVLFPHLSALENVAFGPISRRVDHRTARRLAHEWLERLDLGDLAARRPSELSGGQAQRVALARALVSDPRLLLLDEPLSALDVTTRANLRRTLLEHLAGFDGPRLVVAHEPMDALLLADRVAVVEDGRIVQEGTPDDIRQRPRTAYVADLAGVNLFRGDARNGIVRLAGGHELHIADTTIGGDVAVTVHPHAVAVHSEAPHGSARNVWPTVVTAVEPLGDRTRVQLGEPLRLTAEITREAAADLGLAPGTRTWLAIKATEMDATPI
jgi:molybdate transport system ATP-binding protein